VKMRLSGSFLRVATTLLDHPTEFSLLGPSQTSNGLIYGKPKWRISVKSLAG
jgi:hypothetical protein